MKDILERFDLNEFLAYVCPGVIVLASLTFWYRPNFENSFWKQEFLLVSLGLILSYTLGWILAAYNLMAIVRYRRASGIRKRTLPIRILTGVKRAIFVFSSPGISPSMLEANLKIEEGLEKISKDIGLPILKDRSVLPADRPVAYRRLVTGRVGHIGEYISLHADYYHKRFLFSIGMAVALLILSIQSLLRLVADVLDAIDSTSQVIGLLSFSNNQWLPIKPDWFMAPHWSIVISIVGLLIGFELRQVAIRMWELERYLTASLVSYSEASSYSTC